MLADTLERMLIGAVIPLTLVVLLAAVVERVPNLLSPAMRSWLWRGVFVKALLVVLLPASFIIPIGTMSQSFDTTETTNRAESDLPFKENSVLGSALPTALVLENGLSPTSAHEVQAIETPPLHKTSLSESLSHWAESLRIWVHTYRGIWIPLWLAGFLGLIALNVCEYLRLKRRIERSRVEIDSQLLTLVAQTARTLGVRGRPRLRASSSVSGPMLLLGSRSQLVLPHDFEDRFGREACEMAIAHELAHYHRRDLAWNALVTFVLAALFFWPPVWFAAARYFLAMEMACDQFAINRAKLNLARYAQLLVRLLENSNRACKPSIALTMVQSGAFRSLSERIRSMKAESGRRFGLQAIVACMTFVLITLVLMPWGIADEKPKKKSKSASSRSAAAAGTGSPSLPLGSTQEGEYKPNSSVISGSASASAFSWGSSSSSGGSSGGFGGGASSSSAGVSIGGLPGQSSSSSRSPGSSSSFSGQGSSAQQSSNGNAKSSSITYNGTSISRTSDEVDGETITTTIIKNKKHEVTIRESSDEGLEVRIRELGKGKGKNKVAEYAAPDRETLRQEHPEAYDWVRKYGDDEFKLDGSNLTFGNAKSDLGVDGNVVVSGDNAALPAMERQIEGMIEQAKDNPMMQQQLRQMLEQVRGMKK